MTLRPVLGDVALPLAERAAGTYFSGTVAPPGLAGDVVMTVHATAVEGSPTLDCSLQESDDGSSWSAVPGSSAVQLTDAGNAVAAGTVSKRYVRATSTVGGTDTPSVTYKVMLLVL